MSATAHPVQWLAAAPLWPQAADAASDAERGAFVQPCILRFATDTFMEDFMKVLAASPGRLPEYLARPETWRGPAATPTPTAISSTDRFARRIGRLSAGARQLPGSSTPASRAALAASQPSVPELKLYQPAHQRYYLLTASLVCQVPGLPDRHVDSAADEKVSFVIRRLLPAAGTTPASPAEGSWTEHALVGGTWKAVSDGAGLEEGEEQLPLFPASFLTESGRARRLFAGLIPVARRDAYLGGAPVVPPGTTTLNGHKLLAPRSILVRTQVTEPWKALIGRAEATAAILSRSDPAPTDDEKRELINEVRSEIQTASWYVLLDFGKYLQQYLPNVWKAIRDEAVTLSSGEQALADRIRRTVTDSSLRSVLATSPYTEASVARSLKDALEAVVDDAGSVEAGLERATGVYDRRSPAADWPSFLFPLADPVYAGPQAPGADTETDKVNALAALVDAALPAESPAAEPARALAAHPVAGIGGPGWFVARCVYERSRCPLQKPLLSARTRVFQMAAFFDPDAPARPIRIGLPVDTSPAGLRKFDKNTAFMVSDMLCGQMARAKGLSFGDLVMSVLPWPFHKDLPGSSAAPCKDSGDLPLGMMCSFSIPIITICALILLMIMVNLLNVIFRWVPFFFTCFPLPGFKAKPKEA